MFSLGLYLNWDPSHLMWIGIDPVATILPYADRIVHAQAKDVELDPVARNRYGTFGIVDKGGDPWRTGWWRYRVPGRGQVDWPGVVDRLYEAGFTGTLSVEHEDPLWGGTPAEGPAGTADRAANPAPADRREEPDAHRDPDLQDPVER